MLNINVRTNNELIPTYGICNKVRRAVYTLAHQTPSLSILNKYMAARTSTIRAETFID